MKTEPLEPPRLAEEGPEGLRRLVRARRRRPAGANVDRISEQLVRAGVLGTAAGRGLRGDKATGYSKLGAIGLALIGGLALTWEFARAPAMVSTVAEVAPSAAEQEPAITSEPPADSAAAIAVDQLPTAEPASPAAKSPRSTPSPRKPNAKPRSATAGVNRSARELELLQRAQAAITTDPALSLLLTNEHARDFPSGEFVQEREMLAIEALSRLGNEEAARRRAHALLERFPQTPYSVKIEMLLGKSL